MPTVQLFATCLGDLAFPDAVFDAEALLREAGFEVFFPDDAGLLRTAGLQRGASEGGEARRPHLREGLLPQRADRAAVRLLRGDGLAPLARAARRGAVGGLRALGLPRLGRLRAAAAQRGADSRLSRLVPHAARAADLRRAARPARGVGRDGHGAAAAGSLLRLRRHVLGAPAGDLARDGRREARRARPEPRRSSPPTRAASRTCAAAPRRPAARASSTSRPRSRGGSDERARPAARPVPHRRADHARERPRGGCARHRDRAPLRPPARRMGRARRRPGAAGAGPRDQDPHDQGARRVPRRFPAAVEARGGHVHRCADAAEARATITEICRRREREDRRQVEVDGRPRRSSLNDGARGRRAGGRSRPISASGSSSSRASVPRTSSRPRSRDRAATWPSCSSPLEAERCPGRPGLADAVRARAPARGLHEGRRRDHGRELRRRRDRLDLHASRTRATRASSRPCPRVHVVARRDRAPRADDRRALAVLLRLLARSATGQRALELHLADLGPAPSRRGGRARGAAHRDPRQRPLEPARDALRGDARTASAAAPASTSARSTARSAAAPTGRSTPGRSARCSCRCSSGSSRRPRCRTLSSLCGACTDACPVKIPLHDLLLDLRDDLVGTGVASRWERFAFTAWSFAWSSPLGYRVSTALARLGQPLSGLAGPGRVWAQGRTFPKLSRRYRDRR